MRMKYREVLKLIPIDTSVPRKKKQKKNKSSIFFKLEALGLESLDGKQIFRNPQWLHMITS
jgi:hypothetical protein